MHAEIIYGPGAAAARVALLPGETITAEAGAMIAMSGDTRVETTARARTGGGSLRGLVCKFRGRGTVWCQSHNPLNYGRILGPMLRPRQ